MAEKLFLLADLSILTGGEGKCLSCGTGGGWTLFICGLSSVATGYSVTCEGKKSAPRNQNGHFNNEGRDKHIAPRPVLTGREYAMLLLLR